jgi:2-polyprenyl-6-methoxyphenol hydroxylase-like FAD-dependent oxidoreductase
VTAPVGRVVVVVGGGPAGVLLTYLLARAGVAVTLLEARGDFARRYRGDTLSPEVLAYLDDLGLAEPLLAEVEHTVIREFRWHAVGDDGARRVWRFADPRLAEQRFGFATIPQSVFLPWLAARAEALGARVEMRARFRDLVRDADGRVAGVEYTRDAEPARLAAALVVGADGRHSKVRPAAGIAATELGASLDILWFSVPRLADDPPRSGLDLVGVRHTILGVLDQRTDWQLGYMIPAGTLDEVRARGIGPLLADVAAALPFLADRLGAITDVTDLTLLPVRVTTVQRWSTPGFALLGDAAHVISPIGGNGINIALGDAADLANRIVAPLAAGDTAALDAAVGGTEAARRPAIERIQHRHVRVEARSAERMRRGDPRPPRALRALAVLARRAPWLVRRLRSAGSGRGQLAVPPPVAAIRDGAATRR